MPNMFLAQTHNWYLSQPTTGHDSARNSELSLSDNLRKAAAMFSIPELMNTIG